MKGKKKSYYWNEIEKRNSLKLQSPHLGLEIESLWMSLIFSLIHKPGVGLNSSERNYWEINNKKIFTSLILSM